MRKSAIALLLCLAACGPKGSDLNVTVSGVTMASVEEIRGKMTALQGVSGVQAGAFKDGKATFTVKYAGKGPDLASKLAALDGMKNITGFDDQSVQVYYGSAVAVVSSSAKATEDKPAPNPSPTAVTPPAPVLGPTPTKPAPAPPTPAPVAAPAEAKEVQVEMKKDPLAYKVQQVPGGSIATFEGWKFQALGSDGTWAQFETHPEGKENDFQILLTAGTPGRDVMNNLFAEAAKLMAQLLPAAKAAGEAQKATIGGDEARVQDYTLEAQGKKMQIQSIVIRKKDVAVSVLGIGTEEGFKEFGRSVGITAQSITIKEEPPDRGLVGTWLLEKYSSSGAGTSNAFSHSSSCSLTIYPNGTFTEHSSSMSTLSNTTGRTEGYLDGGDRGRVVKRGNTLTFTYDNGKIWNTDYRFDGGAVWFGKNLWMKQN